MSERPPPIRRHRRRWVVVGLLVVAVVVTFVVLWTRPGAHPVSVDTARRRLHTTTTDRSAPSPGASPLVPAAGVYAYPLDAAGDVGERRRLLDARPMLADDAPGITDGMKVAADGTLFCSAPGGLLVMTPEAEPLGLISDGRAIANCCFGEDGRTLFMTASDRVLRLALRIDGWKA